MLSFLPLSGECGVKVSFGFQRGRLSRQCEGLESGDIPVACGGKIGQKRCWGRGLENCRDGEGFEINPHTHVHGEQASQSQLPELRRAKGLHEFYLESCNADVTVSPVIAAHPLSRTGQHDGKPASSSCQKAPYQACFPCGAALYILWLAI
ncbi:hypothetical protein AOLI_G00178390 [Acnodon oligacanthus]